MMVRVALIVALAVAALAACGPPTHVEGHKIRAVAAAVPALHQGAPAWFTDWWGDYLRRARGGYAVLALDRNGRGGWYVYCGTSGCDLLDHIRAGPIKDVQYEHRALRLCREGVAKVHPTARPSCALYAIENKIVWQGPLPWEGAEGLPARRASVGATPDLIGPSLALSAIEFWRGKWLDD